jgi:hypothetical protein
VGTDGCGDLSHAVTGARAHLVEGVGGVREQRQQGDQAAGDDERLGDGGVPDGVRVGVHAVVDEVEPGDRGQPVQPVLEAPELEPRGEEAGRLCTLAGRDDH